MAVGIVGILATQPRIWDALPSSRQVRSHPIPLHHICRPWDVPDLGHAVLVEKSVVPALKAADFASISSSVGEASVESVVDVRPEVASVDPQVPDEMYFLGRVSWSKGSGSWLNVRRA